MLLGRERELGVLTEVCAAAAAGRGSTLVVAGEPGIGKTALLSAALAAGSDDWGVLRATGAVAESTLAFTGLQALLWPLRDALGELESGQAALLGGVLSLGRQESVSTFALGAATLSLLSLASAERALIAVVDDAHWLDIASQEVLAFVGRRLGAERAALLIGARTEEPCLLAQERSFGRLELNRLDAAVARDLLERSAAGALGAGVAEQLVAACAGNPLGLVELPQLLTEAQLRGREPLPQAPTAGPLVQRAFSTRVERLGADARAALLLLAAAAESGAALRTMDDAELAGLEQAEAAGLLTARPRIDFRHPLLRAAVYAAAAPAARRAAHARLAGASAGARRAWHLAEAAAGTDEATAEALEQAAVDARNAGGVTAEAQALERAAELTPERERRAQRLLAAAQAWRLAARMDRADGLLEQALPLASERTQGEIQLERGRALVRGPEPLRSHEILLPAAEKAAARHPRLAARLLVEASIAADITQHTALAIELAERARALSGCDGGRAELEAVNALLTVRTSMGAPPDERDAELLQRASELVDRTELRAAEEGPWIAYCLALHERDGRARSLSDRCLAASRGAGDVWSLCFDLYARAALEQAIGRIDIAHAWAGEAVSLAEEIGETFRLGEAYGVMLDVEMARGNAEECERLLAVRWSHLGPTTTTMYEFFWHMPLGVARLARADFEQAIVELELAARHVRAGPSRAWYHFVPLELAEAYALAGRRREAAALLQREAPSIDACRLVRPRAKLARVRALLARADETDAAFARVVSLLDEVPQQLERARTELNWGERLQALRRPTDATPHLEHALAGFSALGADGWAVRARATLEVATGMRRSARPRRSDALTAQELRVARHAAAGMRDREIAAVLYLSPRTVESYLHSAYGRLGISNRTQLAGVLAADGVRPIEAPGSVRQLP